MSCTSTPVAEFREPLRVLLGDLNADVHTYSDANLDAGVRAAVRLQQVPGLTLLGGGVAVRGSSGAGLSVTEFARLCYRTARSFVAANPDAYEYRTRALSEKFSGWRNLLGELEDRLHEMENGTMFMSWEQFRSFCAGPAGLNRLALVTEMTGSPPREVEAYPTL